MRAHVLHAVVLFLAGTLAFTPSAIAQGKSGTSGIFLGASLNGSAIKADDLNEDAESGGGLTLQLGYGFTKNFALFLEGTGSSMQTEGSSWGLGHFDIGARYHFANPSRSVVPFLEAAFTGRAGVEDDAILIDDLGNPYTGNLEISGTGFTFGGGLLFFLNQSVALNTGLKWTMGEFSTVKFGNVSVDGLEADATSARLNLGLTWFPQGGSR